MLILGIIVLVIGYLLGIGILETVGTILLVIGLILLLLGAVGGPPIAGRRWWY